MSLLLLLAFLLGTDGETGTLRLHSQAGAQVIWEGVALGSTDSGGVLTVSDIPPGTFTLALRKSGFRDFQTSVTITAGEVTSLEAQLQPSVPLPAAGPAGKRPQTAKAPAPGKQAEAAGAEQDNRVSQLPKSPPQEGREAVWPSASQPAPENTETGAPIWVWPLLLGSVLLGVVFWLSRKLKPTSFSSSPALLAGSDVPQPTQSREKTAAFLSDLKKREELLEQGVEVVSTRAKGPVIDLDSANVREVEEP